MGSRTTSTPVIVTATGDSLKFKQDGLNNNNAFLAPSVIRRADMSPVEGRGFTFAFWIKHNTHRNSSDIRYMTGFNSSSVLKLNITRANIGSNNGQLEVQFKDSGGASNRLFFHDWFIDYENFTADGATWKHYVFQWTGETSSIINEFKAYVNGVEILPDSHVDGGATTLDMVGGSTALFGVNTLVGGSGADLNDVNVTHMVWWNESISAAAVTELYNEGKMFDVKERHSLSSTVVAYWKMRTEDIIFDSNNAVTCSDSSGNGLHVFNYHKGTGAFEVDSNVIPFTDDEIITITTTSGVFSSPVLEFAKQKAAQGTNPTIEEAESSTIPALSDLGIIVFNDLNVPQAGVFYPTKNYDPQFTNIDADDGAVVPTIRVEGQSPQRGVSDGYFLREVYSQTFTGFKEEGFTSGEKFFLTGTDPNVIPGFESKLKDKKRIVLSIPTQGTHQFGVINASNANSYINDTSNVRQPLMGYYNRDLKKWEPIARGLSVNQGEKTTIGLKNTLNDSALGFSNVTGDLIYRQDDNAQPLVGESFSKLPAFGRPTKVYGFPFHGKYHATSSQIFNMSDFISEPFLLEKCILEISCSVSMTTGSGMVVRSGSSDDLVFQEGDKINNISFMPTFFLLNQRKGHHDFSLIVNDQNLGEELMISSSIPGIFTTAENTNRNVDTVRDLVTYGQISMIARDTTVARTGELTLDEYLKKGLSRDLNIKRENFNVGSGSIEGTFRLEFPSRTSGIIENGPSLSVVLNNGVTSSISLSDPFGGRFDDNLDFSTSRAITGGVPSGFKDGHFMTGPLSGSVTMTEVSANSSGSFDTTSPYVLLPGDNIILGCQAPFSNNIFLNGPTNLKSHKISLTMGQLDDAKLILYGSEVRKSRETESRFRQQLISEAVSTSIGSKGFLPLDEFITEPKNTMSGTYVDRFVEGSINSVRGINGLFSNGTAGDDVGAFRRFVNLPSINEKIIDSILPSIKSYMEDLEIAISNDTIQSTVGTRDILTQNGVAKKSPFEIKKQRISNEDIKISGETLDNSRKIIFMFGRDGVTMQSSKRGTSGFLYGIDGLLPRNEFCIFRHDKFGQKAYMLEQRRDTATISGESFDAPLIIRYVKDGDQALPADTISVNLSPFATSSIPFEEGKLTERNIDPISIDNTSIVRSLDET